MDYENGKERQIMELPSAFAERMRQMLGDEYPAFRESYEKERSQGLRLNGLKTDREAFLKTSPFSLRPIPWAAEGFYYRQEERPGRHPYHEAGAYYIQEPSAMAVVTFLDPQPGERILDLCAAPGGKTTQIASRMGGKGLLLSNEIHPARAKILSQNVERMGIRNAVVSNEDSARLAGCFPEFFDRIAVDAPCSGEGMFRKDETAVAEWSPENVKRCAARQQEILENASAMLRPGGRLVYSTCTFAPEENEGTIARFLAAHPDYRVEEVPEYPGLSHGVPEWGETGVSAKEAELFDFPGCLRRTVRIWPHRTEGEGHYIAVLRKGGARQESRLSGPAFWKDRTLFKYYAAFCEEALSSPREWIEAGGWILFGDQLYRLPEGMPDFSGLRILRPGLHLGSFKKNRFEPSHALALALRGEEAAAVRNLPAESPLTEAYLRGEALPDGAVREAEREAAEAAGAVLKAGRGPEKGWVLMQTNGYSIGWAKLAGGILKNHYPKGLRK